jgi:hypothetical protein
MSAPRIFLCLTSLALLGCKERVATETVPITTDRFGRTSEVGLQPEALTLKELAFMVRAQIAEAEITAELARRGLAEPIDEKARHQLIESGATQAFIVKVEASPAVLTPQERALYAERLERRTAASSAAANDHDRWVEESRADLTKKVNQAQITRLDNQRTELNAKIGRLQLEQSREKYSRNSSSPYQGLQRQIAEVNGEVSRLSGEIDKLRSSNHPNRR